MKRRHHLVLCAFIGATLSGLTLASPAAPESTRMQRSDCMHEDHRPGSGLARGAEAAGYRAERLQQLKQTLAITADQEPVWQQFAATLTRQAQEWQQQRQQWRAKRQARTEDGHAPAPQALEYMQQRLDMAQRHVQQMQERTAAFKNLYAALTAEQQRLADQQFFRHAQASHGKHRHHGHHDHEAAARPATK